MKTKMFKYQIVVVLPPKLEEKTSKEVLNKVQEGITEVGGKVAGEDHIGMKDFVYTVREFERGDFWSFEVESITSLKLKDFNLMLNRENNIIRYLILRRS